jgi:formylglycine-generating enzyme required for sulfatase activity
LLSDNKPAWRGALRFLKTQSHYPYWAEVSAQVYEDALGEPSVFVPAGAFLMGSDKSKDPKAYDDELPQYSVTLPGYWIGRYPVTVAQWKIFVKESGHPSDPKSLQDPDNHPVRYVNWNDALAYCNWLSEKSGLPVTLPSEAEWEKAARSTDGRIYPWGDEFDKNKCNTYESGIENTTPVGKYSPAGDSPYGCADMAGNVWEWTRSKYKPYPYHTEDGREDLQGNDFRVVRGGSWNFTQYSARASARSSHSPYLRNPAGVALRYNFGFRLVVRPPSL